MSTITKNGKNDEIIINHVKLNNKRAHSKLTKKKTKTTHKN